MMMTLEEHEAATAALPPGEPAGTYDGDLVWLRLPRRLAPRLRSGIFAVAARVAPVFWKGKRFDGAEGANVWIGGWAFARFAVRDGSSLSYDVPRNPRPLRPIRGELALRPDGTILGRMSYGRHTLLLFALARRSS